MFEIIQTVAVTEDTNQVLVKIGYNVTVTVFADEYATKQEIKKLAIAELAAELAEVIQ